jgi:hypothetical protein
MSTRLGKSEADLLSSQHAVRRTPTGPSNMPKTLAPGMGTKNFVTEILDIFAGLDRDRKQELINYSSQLADAQRAEKTLLAL